MWVRVLTRVVVDAGQSLERSSEAVEVGWVSCSLQDYGELLHALCKGFWGLKLWRLGGKEECIQYCSKRHSTKIYKYLLYYILHYWWKGILWQFEMSMPSQEYICNFKYIKIENSYLNCNNISQYYRFYCIFYQIIAALVSMRDLKLLN